MSKKKPQLAKLSRPRLHRPVPRERLFRLLDEKREHPVVWIAGPPGAGKTTLVASYLEEADTPAIWYQIDPGDTDPAAFFYYLKQAVDRSSAGRDKPLPLLASEYLADLAAFARQFLRDAFARLPDGAVLVLDNYQELPENSAVHSALKAGVAEIPEGANILVVSRADLPSHFAQPLVNRQIAVLSWADLRLTPEETRLVAAVSGVTDSATLRVLHATSGGWMAGLTLMLDSVQSSGVSEEQDPQNLTTLFEYFADLIFQDASAKMQDVLLKTSFLPWVNGRLAELATGLPDAIVEVENLHRRHLFTDRRAGSAPTYQYHALLRTFLRSRAIAALSLETRCVLLSRIASELFSAGHADEAFASYKEADDWAGAERVVTASAPRLAKQGRWQTLAQWIEALPALCVEANPWVTYWKGRVATYLDPSSAQTILDVAYRAFVEIGDTVGQLLCATTVLEGIYFSAENLRAMDPWIERVVELLEQGVQAPQREDELRVQSSVMLGATLRRPTHSMLPRCLQRVFELLKEPLEPNLKVSAAIMLHGYADVAMDSDVERMAAAIARPLLSSKELSPIRAVSYWAAEGYSHYVRGRHAEAFACFDSADAIVKEHAIRDANMVASLQGRAVCERRAGLLDEAEATTRRAESLSLPTTGYRRGQLFLMKGVVAFDRGNVQQAIEHGLKAYARYEEAGSFNGVITVGTVVANMAIPGGRFDIAAQMLANLRREAHGAIAQNYIAAIVLNQAWLQHRMGETEVRDELLRDALQRSSLEGARIRLHWYMNAMSELLPVAIARGIETETAIGLAREFAVRPNPVDVEKWPWPVTVHTLGRFSLAVDGQAPEYSRKLPRKVLALLKAVIAFGAREVPEQKIMAALWPDEEGDAAQRSLSATLHRLRKLLGNATAMRQAGGELTLDAEMCWVDALAFEHRAASDSGQLGAAIDLYGGAFLAQEEDAPWAVPMRERLRAKFIQAVAKRASGLESADDHEGAVALYQRGIGADPLVEDFYQGLMRSYERLNRKAEAVSAYRRLRQTLSVTLGVLPSEASQRLFESLRTE